MVGAYVVRLSSMCLATAGGIGVAGMSAEALVGGAELETIDVGFGTGDFGVAFSWV